MKTFICVRWQFEGFHSYPSAPGEVAFLKNVHRHLFKCSAKIEVFHDDRELEFFIVQRKLRSIFDNVGSDSMSCEMIANKVVSYVLDTYPGRSVTVEVSEDGENSSIVEYQR